MLRTLQRDRALTIGLAISLLFHLSMVTVFRIVIYFPRNDTDYVNFAIVPASSRLAAARSGEETLQVPSADEGFDRFTAATARDSTPLNPSAPPEVQLPRLGFAQLDRLRLQTRALETRSRYTETFAQAPSDTWERFGSGVGSLSDALGRFTEAPDESKAEPHLIPVSRPAPGFEAYLEWMTPPYTRQPLSVSRIESLWGLRPGDLNEPIVLVFKADRDGNVTEVLTALLQKSSLAEDSAAALRRYRFEPVGDTGPAVHAGTLIVRAADSAP